MLGPWMAFGFGLALLAGIRILLEDGKWSGFLVALPLGIAVGLGGALYRTWERGRQRRS